MPSNKSTRAPARRPKVSAQPDPALVAQRAYFLWLEDPAANGDPEANWLRAEAELASQKPVKPRAASRRPRKKTT